MYVASPATVAKNEYHSLVSPVVLSGGLSRANQSPAIKVSNINAEMHVDATAGFLNEQKDSTEPRSEKNTAERPNHMNIFQPIMTSDL